MAKRGLVGFVVGVFESPWTPWEGVKVCLLPSYLCWRLTAAQRVSSKELPARANARLAGALVKSRVMDSTRRSSSMNELQTVPRSVLFSLNVYFT